MVAQTVLHGVHEMGLSIFPLDSGAYPLGLGTIREGAMPKKGKRIDRTDKWYVLAKEQGYRSRAAFKLAQISACDVLNFVKLLFLSDKEFSILNASTRTVLDLCAAPGGWSQVAAKTVSSSCCVVAVDLLPIRPIGGVRTIVGDITQQKTHDAVKREVRSVMGKKLVVDVALCDGAPNVGAAYTKDAFVQNEISLAALKCAVDCGLSRGACFVTKVYRGRDYNPLIWAFGRLFERVRAFKPAASRSQSAEIFVVCQNYLAPVKVDPKLLDAKSVFTDVPLESSKKALSVLHPQYGKKRRQRDGYDTELLATRQATEAEFVCCNDPAQFLADYDVLDLGEDAPEELKALGKDLRILNRTDMRQLLKWRDKQRKHSVGARPNTDIGGHQKQDRLEDAESVDSEDAVQRDIARERAKASLEARRLKKRRRRLDAKQRARRAIGITEESAVELGDSQIFSYSASLDIGDRGAVEEDDAFIETGHIAASGCSEAGPKKHRKAIMYADESERDLAIESQLDDAYGAYLERRGRVRGADEVRLLAKRKRDAIAAEVVSDQLALEDGDVEAYVNSLATPEDEDENQVDETAAGRWFAKPIFADLPKTDRQARHEKRRKAIDRAERRKKHKGGELTDLEVVAKDDDELQKGSKHQHEAEHLIKRGIGDLLTDNDSSSLEVVKRPEAPLQSFSVDADDLSGRAERLALATTMLRRSKAKALVDASYNRYAWHDPTDLPEWFVADEKLHYRPQLPLKPEVVAEMKQKFKSLATKPIKKVVEARARKKARANVKLKAAKRKADAIADNPDMTPAQKVRAVQKAMAKGGKIDKPSKLYVVQRKTKSGAISKLGSKKRTKNSRIKLVDRRLKKDKRGMKAAAKHRKAGGNSKGAAKKKRRH